MCLESIFFGKSAKVTTDQVIRELYDDCGTAIILRKLEQVHIEVFLKRPQTLRTCPTPLINNLVIIRDDKEIFCCRINKMPKYFILRKIRILKLIHTDIWIDSLYLRTNPRILFQKSQGFHNQTHKIE